ncbi:uncharacterized protein DMENIID0001_151810 [Sergentomyia squamirostris]
MPRYKPIRSLYSKSLDALKQMLWKRAIALDHEDPCLTNRNYVVNQINEYVAKSLPSRILDELLFFQEGTSAMYALFLLRSDIQKFKAKNIVLTKSHWEEIFTNQFQNLIVLNLSLSCTDYILENIPKCCPHLQVLNATCRYERMRIGLNAAAFSLPVTDRGLEYLWDCQKLRVLVVNEPRSQSRGIQTSITYAGLRKLLEHAKSIENITYSDMGSVVSKGMEHVDHLNLRAIKHFNATAESMEEIFRLCTKLEEISLTFFENTHQRKVLGQIIKAKPKLRCFQLIKFNCNPLVKELFEAVGEKLQILHMTEYHDPLRFCHVVCIARSCPILRHMTLLYYSDDSKNYGKPPNFGQFTKLDTFEILCCSIDFNYMLKFCLQNCQDVLKNMTVTNYRRDSYSYVDEFFLNNFTFSQLLEVTISECFRFTPDNVMRLILKSDKLQYINVYSPDAYNEIPEFIKRNNFDVMFVNKTEQYLE